MVVWKFPSIGLLPKKVQASMSVKQKAVPLPEFDEKTAKRFFLRYAYEVICWVGFSYSY
jgi:hypothetical protein